MILNLNVEGQNVVIKQVKNVNNKKERIIKPQMKLISFGRSIFKKIHYVSKCMQNSKLIMKLILLV